MSLPFLNFFHLSKNIKSKYLVLDSIPQPIMVIDREYNVIFANDAFKSTFKNKGTKCYQLIGKKFPCQICTASIAFHKNTSQSKDFYLQNKNFKVNTSLLKDKDDFFEAFIESYQDISQTKDLENKLLEKNTILGNDLKIAKKVQQSLLPKDYSDKNISISSLYNPCDDLGGDFYDFFKIDSDHYGVYIADVSGHGISAAMITMFIDSAFNKSCTSPKKVLSELFKHFNRNKFYSNKYVTIFFLVIDIKNNTITYSNAGHNCSPIIFDTFLEKTTILEQSGFPISTWVSEPEYIEETIEYEPNSRILLYTDGAIEVTNSNQIPFGEKRLIQALMEGNPSTGTTMKRIINYIENFTNQPISTINDDISFVIIDL